MYSTHWLVRLGLTGAAFVGAVLAVLLTLVLARGVQHTLRLLLAGVIVGVVLGALKTSLILLLSPDIAAGHAGLHAGQHRLCGLDAPALLMAAVWLLCLVVAWAAGARCSMAWRWAKPPPPAWACRWRRMRAALVAVLALATGTAVAQTGLDCLCGPGRAAPGALAVSKTTHGRLMLLSSLMGGALLMVADVLARWLIAPQELPVGVLTAVLGGGYLLWLMHRRSCAGRFAVSGVVKLR